MKSVILALLIPFAVLGQAPKKTNTIIVTTEKSYQDIAKALILGGYAIKSSDEAIGLLVTDDKSERRYRYYLSMNLIDGQIVITGKFVVPSIDDTYESIVNRGGKGSAFKESFLKMEAFAVSLGGELRYTTR